MNIKDIATERMWALTIEPSQPVFRGPFWCKMLLLFIKTAMFINILFGTGDLNSVRDCAK